METRLLRKTILFIGDAAILVAALYLTLLIRYGHNLTAGLWRDHIGPFGPVLIVMLVVFYINDLYELTLSRGRFQLFNRLFQSFLISGGIAIVFFYIGSDRLFTIKPQRVFLIYIQSTGTLAKNWQWLTPDWL
jgi:hypothetical protein